MGHDDTGLEARHIGQRESYDLAASGRYRAVVAGTVGRAALPAAYRGARAAGISDARMAALTSTPAAPSIGTTPGMRTLSR